MSFILDALKKSETDRQRNTGPGIYELKVAPPRPRFPLWALIVAMLLGVNLLIGVWYLMRTDQPTPVTRDDAAPAAAIAGTQVETVERTDIERGIFNPADFEPAIDPEAPPAATSKAPGTAKRSARNTRTAVPIIESEPGNARPATTPRPSTQGLPSRDDLVLDGLQVPEVSMNLHVYDPDPSKRFAFINGSRTAKERRYLTD